MSHGQGYPRANCTLLAVFCGKFADGPREEAKRRPSYPSPELLSSGRLEVHTLINPTLDKFRDAQKSLEPNILYLQGEQLENEEEIGSLVWREIDVSDPEKFSSLIGPSLPTIVYLEFPNSEKVAHAARAKGVPYVIHWRNLFSSYAASHFRQALFSVVQSSFSHIWDAFQLAHASFRLYCARSNHVLPGNCQKINGKIGPCLLGDTPKVNIKPQENLGEEAESVNEALPAIKIYDEDVDIKFLVCGLPCTLDACLLGSLEDGLNALLNIEIRGSRLHNRVSAAPPPLQAGTFSRGVVTMRCDFTTCSSAHISLLISGSAQTCFDDQLLESHVKNDIVEKSQLVHALPSCEEAKPPFSDPLTHASIASGASVFEVSMKVPTWAAQVLKQLAPDLSYRSLVSLGIASIQGTSVASFDKEDAERLLFFCSREGNDLCMRDIVFHSMPSWHSSLTSKRSMLNLDPKSLNSSLIVGGSGFSSAKVGQHQDDKEKKRSEGTSIRPAVRQRPGIAPLRPIPPSRQHKMLPFTRISEINAYDGNLVKPNLPTVPIPKHNSVPAAPSTHRKSTSSSFRAQHMIPLNPLPMKKHGCDRCSIQVCSEEEFLRDVMQFLILRGHNRLVPQGGIAEFPDAILNAKRLDLYNLYREVVSRGGFYVGNGINWKGQVFSKMRNHTMTNRMTGVGNTLKRHYETYLLEYELAHDDVDGECCLLCHSAPGDWVNCGLCGEWAHFGCDRRQGLGTFKDYAKTDGLDYICPQCSVTNHKIKTQKLANGFRKTSVVSRLV